MVNQQLNSCPASTPSMKNPILWKKNSGGLDLGNKQYPKVCTVRARIKQHPLIAASSDDSKGKQHDKGKGLYSKEEESVYIRA